VTTPAQRLLCSITITSSEGQAPRVVDLKDLVRQCPPFMLSLLPSALVLGIAALAAIHFTTGRRSPPDMLEERLAAARALAIAAAVQCLHFLEEALTGFNTQLGGLFGLPEMSQSFFLAFNVVWLAIWAASVPAVRSGRAGGFFAAWFLAIAGTVNGIAHPLLAGVAGGYFPGLVSSPFIGAVSVWLWVLLGRATVPRAHPSDR
jgi:hypothetical protein